MSKKIETKYRKLEEAYKKLFDAYTYMEAAYVDCNRTFNEGFNELQIKRGRSLAKLEYQLAKSRRDKSLSILEETK